MPIKRTLDIFTTSLPYLKVIAHLNCGDCDTVGRAVTIQPTPILIKLVLLLIF